jgi:hypothetical protein
MRGRWSVRFVAGASIVLAAVASQATVVRQQPLDELVQEAERVFVGTCVDARDGAVLPPGGGHPIPYAEYTFEVRDVLKGRVGTRVTIRQFGTRTPRPTSDGRHAVVSRVPGMPQYEPGQEVLLLLTGDSGLGLTSPVGLGQGAFRVAAAAGKRVAVNAFDNRGLFRGMSVAAPPGGPSLRADEAALLSTVKGPVELDTLASLIRTLAVRGKP